VATSKKTTIESDNRNQKIVGFIINIFIPGLGTLFVKRYIRALIQLTLFAIAIFLYISVLGAIFGMMIWLTTWVWSLVTVAFTPTVSTIKVIER
jgi:TM2 domain-containing membrane protein YozV